MSTATYASNVAISGTLTVSSSNVQANVLSGNIWTTLGGVGGATAAALACYSTVVVMKDGTVRSCGANDNGQLGHNDLTQLSTMVPVLGISSQAIAVAITYHMAILLNDGTVRSCGVNTYGQLGVNDLNDRSTVVPVVGISSQAIAVACGFYHTAILLRDGTVRVCGRNHFGQLGQNNIATTRSTVVAVVGISSQAIAVACGKYHTAILLNNGSVRVCGNNQYGQLGLNYIGTTRSSVISVLNVTTAIGVACGWYHTAILLRDGTVRVCGRDDWGQLGQNTPGVTKSTVVAILGISSQAIAVACGGFHTAVLLNDGTVYTCGRNYNGFVGGGQLGDGTTTNMFTVVPVLNVSTAIAITCARYQTAVLTNDGIVRACGVNIISNLGLNDNSARNTVTPILNLLSLNTTIFSLSSNLISVPALGLGITNPIYQLDLSTDNARKTLTQFWTTGSDEALKTNIELADLDRCVDIVSKLDLKYFKWEIPSDDTHSLGWIAQEVEQIFPKAVRTSDTHGISDFKDLNTDQIIKVMWGALKKLRADLKSKRQ